MPISGKEAVKRLKKSGYVTLRINGSHHIMSNGEVKVTVPVHANRDMKQGTLKSIEKLTGVELS